jgi:predicted glycoside hydrolase/deacetylase ChbG (UPF0249 family)
MIIITADDYGKNSQTTDSILECAAARRITSVSAMVFMEDSARAASVVPNQQIEVGLHLNFTLPFTDRLIPSGLADHQARLVSYLTKHRTAQAVFNPFLANSFKYVYQVQKDEFLSLYGRRPDFINGHHHMHLCANVLWGGMLRPGLRIRRPFSVEPAHRNRLYRVYQSALGWWVSRRFVSTDAFFSIVPFQDHLRLEKIAFLGITASVEIEVHPENRDEAGFLRSDSFLQVLGQTALGGFRSLPGGLFPKRGDR